MALGLLLPGIGPALAAWLVDRRTFLAFRVHLAWPWLLLAIATPAALIFFTNHLDQRLDPKAAALSLPVHGWSILPLVLTALSANVWEELGWRCFALRRLQHLYPPWIAAAVVGVLWAAWHAPLLYLPIFGMQRYPTAWWALSSTATAVILAWLWNRTAGSLWGVTVYHVATNISGAAFGVRSYAAKAVADSLCAVALLCWTRGSLGFNRNINDEYAPLLGPESVTVIRPQ